MIVHSSCPVCGSPSINYKLQARDYTVSSELFEIWECLNCSLRFTQHIPASSDIGAYYQSDNYISHTDTRTGLVNRIYHSVRKKTLRAKCALIQKETGMSKGAVLDIGAGTGAFLNAMKQAGWECSGLEPDASARRKAQEIYGLTLKDSEAMGLLYSGSYHAITLWHVLEHVHDLNGYLDTIKRLLAPGGILFIAVPNYTSHDATHYREHWAAYDVPRHLYHFSPNAMRTLINRHSLRLRNAIPMWYDSFYVSMLSEEYKLGKPRHLSAIFNGLVSNIHTIFKKENCSSLIYIIEKGL